MLLDRSDDRFISQNETESWGKRIRDKEKMRTINRESDKKERGRKG